MIDFEKSLNAAALAIRERLAALETPPSEMELTIKVTGRVLDGELKVEIELDGGWSDRSPVKGRDIDAIVTEFLRRRGWDQRHSPLMIGQLLETTDAS